MKQQVFKIYIGLGPQSTHDWFLIVADNWQQASRKAVKRSEEYVEYDIVKMEVIGELD